MGLNASLSIATSGLAAVQSELAVASQNVANANTAGYAVETSAVSSLTAGGQPDGVLVGLTGRTVDTALQNSLYSQNATVSALSTINNGLAPIEALQGSTSADSGSSNTLSDSVGNLQTSLITLETEPSNDAGQGAVISAAQTLSSNIQDTASAYQTQRQAAQDSLADDVNTANSNLQLIGSLSKQIVAGQINNISTADLENQRAVAETALSNVLSVKFTETSSGNVLVTTANGLALPTTAGPGPLETTDATIGVGDAYPGTIPAITLNGRDVTTSLTGGSLGANIQLRDQILPTAQAELDSFSQTLASRFNAQGLTLFTDSNGNLPSSSTTATTPAGQVGFANVIQVNPAVISNPSAIRDGTTDVTGGIVASNGTSSGATDFTVNTSRGADDTTLLDRVLDYALGSDVQSGVSQTAAASSGLGVSGTLSSPYSGSTDLTSLASALTGAQAETIDDVTSNLTNETAVQSSLSSKVAGVSGVSVDDELSSIVTLQNAYAANAKVVTAVQALFTDLLAAITP